MTLKHCNCFYHRHLLIMAALAARQRKAKAR